MYYYRNIQSDYSNSTWFLKTIIPAILFGTLKKICIRKKQSDTTIIAQDFRQLSFLQYCLGFIFVGFFLNELLLGYRFSLQRVLIAILMACISDEAWKEREEDKE